MEATLTEMQAFHVKMKVLRFASFAASTSHVQSPACVHENGKIHVAFVVGKRHSSKTYSTRASHDTHMGSLARRGANPLVKHCHFLTENDGFAHRRANAWQFSTSAWRS